MQTTRTRQSGAAQMVVLIVVAVLLGVGYVALDMYSEGQKYMTMTESRGMQIIQALSKHRLATSAYPDTLDKLTPKFIAALPKCPAGESFVYAVSGGEYKLGCEKVGFKSSPYNYESRSKAWSG